MAARTFAVGDIHGEWEHLMRVWAKLPPLKPSDTVVFLGDYVNRGPRPREVVEFLMELPSKTPAQVICLRGNHEDAWIRARGEGFDGFMLKVEHGCLATLRSFMGGTVPERGEMPTDAEMARLSSGDFLPAPVEKWMAQLPFWHEDGNGIYVHAGLPRGPDGFLHPAKVLPAAMLAWVRTDDFVRNYRGKDVVFGHTPVRLLPEELSHYTPDDPLDAWINDDTAGLDTGCGLGGFLTIMERPSMRVFESRDA
jgi:serine/threonine protein phosphatase 1